MVEVFLGLGSNLGEREANIRRAVKLIDEECVVMKVSQIYETEPVGLKDQPWFLNCAVEVDTHLSPRKLLIFLKTVESRMGRVKAAAGGPRIIDLDILFFGKRVLEDHGDLVIPHPRLHLRRFVLEPLMELCPDLAHPVLGKTVRLLHSELAPGEKVTAYIPKKG